MRGLAIGLAMLAAWGASAQEISERTAIDYLVCLRTRSPQLDDKISDARTVAAAVMQSCKEERIAHKQSLAGVGRLQAVQLMDMSRDHDLDQVSIVVLQERAKARR